MRLYLLTTLTMEIRVRRITTTEVKREKRSRKRPSGIIRAPRATGSFPSKLLPWRQTPAMFTGRLCGALRSATHPKGTVDRERAVGRNVTLLTTDKAIGTFDEVFRNQGASTAPWR